jgi:hypothetical protein
MRSIIGDSYGRPLARPLILRQAQDEVVLWVRPERP